MANDLELRTDGGIARITFTRPDLGNAVTGGQATALAAALEAVVADSAVRVLILTGSGSTFNVGAVAPERREDPVPDDPVAAYSEQIPVMQQVVTRLAESSVVSIAAVNGMTPPFDCMRKRCCVRRSLASSPFERCSM